MKSKNAKQVLDELKWRQGFEISEAKIFYVHRGAPDDTKVIMGSDIQEMDTSFFTTAEASVPYHRIFRIEHRGIVLLDRKR